jgi:hypothetical protein
LVQPAAEGVLESSGLVFQLDGSRLVDPVAEQGHSFELLHLSFEDMGFSAAEKRFRFLSFFVGRQSQKVLKSVKVLQFMFGEEGILLFCLQALLIGFCALPYG